MDLYVESFKHTRSLSCMQALRDHVGLTEAVLKESQLVEFEGELILVKRPFRLDCYICLYNKMNFIFTSLSGDCLFSCLIVKGGANTPHEILYKGQSSNEKTLKELMQECLEYELPKEAFELIKGKLF